MGTSCVMVTEHVNQGRKGLEFNTNQLALSAM